MTSRPPLATSPTTTTLPLMWRTLRREFERIKAAVKDEFDWLYGTEHYEPAVDLYDPSAPDVAGRLKNPPSGDSNRMLLGNEEKTWELLTKTEVEARLGYAVTELSRGKNWGDIDVSKVERWVCIPATIQYTIWSDVYRCEGFVSIEEPIGKVSHRGKNAGKPIVKKKRVTRGCHKSIVLWSAAVDPLTREVREVFRCPHCGQQWKKIQLTRDGDIPVFTVVEFVGRTPRSNSARLKRGRDITVTEKQHLAVIGRQEPKRFFPNAPIDPGREMMRHGLLARGLTKESAFYSPRLLHGLSAIWERVQATRDERVRRALQFTFTAIVHRCSKLNRLRPSGAGDPLTGTLYIGSLWRENHALDDFSERVEALFNLAPNLSSGCVIVTQGSATS